MPSLLNRGLAKARRLKVLDVAHLHFLQEKMHLKRVFDHLGVDIVFDVGANAGQYALRLRRDLGYRGVIVSVEPIPEMIEHLAKVREGDPNWYIEPCAIGAAKGSINFNVMTDLQCSSILEPDNSETMLFDQQTTISRKISVQCELLDNLMHKWLGRGNFSRPFLKLDTQGHDVAIVRSCRKIQEFVGFQSELSVKRLYRDTPLFAEALSTYSELGFDISGLIPNNANNFLQLIEVDCILIRRDLISDDEPSIR